MTKVAKPEQQDLNIKQLKATLERFYDVCNELFKDNPSVFYTHEQIEELKKNNLKNFIWIVKIL